MQGGNTEDSQNRNEVFTIVGLGSSAKDWIPRGHSIGVNDAFRWGKPTDSLLVCNRPVQFSHERQRTIIESKPKNFYSWKSDWSVWFPNYIRINLVTWYGVIHPRQIYSADSGPFIAISLAYTLGAKTIILYGVDFKNHKVFNESNPYTKKEVEKYLQLFAALKEKGCEVFLGASGSAFDNLIPIYEST